MLKGSMTNIARGKRPIGRLRKRWKDNVKELLEKCLVDWEQVYDKD